MKAFSSGIYFFILVFASCVKDKPAVAPVTNITLSSNKKVYVINEGNFGSSNASVSLYDPATEQSVENAYASANDGAAIGDVVQSLSFHNNWFYLVVNNSGKVIVCDEEFKKSGEIQGLRSPRYLLPVSNQKAYVSDLYANGISVVELNNLTKTGIITCPGWTEKMLLIHNKVFVTNLKRDYVYVINTLSDKIEDSVFIGPNASSLALDRNDKLWVLSGGNQVKQIVARLSRLNVLTNTVETYFEFDAQANPGNLQLNKGKDSLYYLSSGIYKMPVTGKFLPEKVFIPASGKTFYGLGIHPGNSHIYAADAIDYSQRSTIYIFDANGKPLANFKAGINSNGFYFE